MAAAPLTNRISSHKIDLGNQLPQRSVLQIMGEVALRMICKAKVEKQTMVKVLGLFILILLVACTTADPEAAEDEPTAVPEAATEVPAAPRVESTATSQPEKEAESADEGTPDRSLRLQATETPKVLERVPDMDTGEAVVGEVPQEIMSAIRADLRQRTGAEEEEIEVLRAEEAIWNDGSLGCPKPGVMYTQAQVHGYWVQLAYAGVTYDYRVNDRGAFFLCESPMPGSSGAPTG